MYAHENKHNCSVLQFDFNKNVQSLHQAFIDRKLGALRNLEQRELEIRFVFLDERVVSQLQKQFVAITYLKLFSVPT